MKCTHCGADIPEGMLICPDCRNEVQMVPDYNPLEDVLVREVRGSIEDATRPIRTDDLRRYRSETEQRTGNSTRVLSRGELDRIRAERMDELRLYGKEIVLIRGKHAEIPAVCVKIPGMSRQGTGKMASGTGTIRSKKRRKRTGCG